MATSPSSCSEDLLGGRSGGYGHGTGLLLRVHDAGHVFGEQAQEPLAEGRPSLSHVNGKEGLALPERAVDTRTVAPHEEPDAEQRIECRLHVLGARALPCR